MIDKIDINQINCLTIEFLRLDLVSKISFNFSDPPRLLIVLRSCVAEFRTSPFAYSAALMAKSTTARGTDL